MTVPKKTKTYLILALFCFLTLPKPSQPEDESCEEEITSYTDYEESECTGENNFYLRDLSDDRCFKKCIHFEKQQWQDGIECTGQSRTECIPGYPCDGEYCTEEPGSCFLYYAYDNDLTATFWKPKCASDGSWAPKQCKGEVTSGRCFCFSPKGQRLFGQSWIKNADNMTCSCSRKREDLLRDPKRYSTTLHCDASGNFEELQCDSGMCWCAEPQTGALKSRIVPEKAMELLDCYKLNSVGGQYLRMCESQLHAQSLIGYELKVHGTLFANFKPLLCDADGSFGKYKIMDGISYCTWRDDSNLGTYQAPVDANTPQLTCNCAKDKKIYSEAGVDHNQMCEGNGEYKRAQSVIDNGESKYYCVDEDGYKSVDDLKDTVEECYI